MVEELEWNKFQLNARPSLAPTDRAAVGDWDDFVIRVPDNRRTREKLSSYAVIYREINVSRGVSFVIPGGRYAPSSSLEAGETVICLVCLHVIAKLHTGDK